MNDLKTKNNKFFPISFSILFNFFGTGDAPHLKKKKKK